MSIFTIINETSLSRLLDAYDLGKLNHFSGIQAGTTNSNYYVTTTIGTFVLTLFEHINAATLTLKLRLLAHLSAHSFPCASPIADRNAQYIHTLQGKPAVIFPKLSGQTLEHVAIAHCEAIGKALASLHLAGQNFSEHIPNPADLTWQTQIAAQVLPSLPESSAQLLRQELTAQQAMSFEHLPKGIIHADLFRDNALFDGTQLCGIIDFDFACFDSLLLDLAITVNDWCLQTDYTINTERMQAILNAYQQQRSFTSQEHQLWPWVLRRAALRWWLRRLHVALHVPAQKNILIKDPNAFEQLLRYHIAHPLSL